MLYALQVGVVEQMGEDAQRQFLQALTKQVNTAGLVIFCMHTRGYWVYGICRFSTHC